MSGALMNKVWDLFGMDQAEPEEYDDENVYEYEDEEEETEVEDRKLFGRKNKVVPMQQAQGNSIKMVISQPTTFEQSDEICSFIKEKKSVMMNGYSVDEVDDFLDDLTLDYTKNYKENTELKAKVEELTKSLEQYRNIEQTLQSTLLMAQTTAEDVKKVAKQQADQIINDAKDTAKQQAIELDNEIIAKRKELDDVKKQFDIYKAKMESLLISQLELLKDVNKDDE